MTELELLLLDRIRHEGPITFAAFQDAALYHPEGGYYAGGAPRSGWRGHFLTSAELDPVFGALWAVAFRRVWESLDRPDEFEVIEIGPGEGGFAQSLLRAVRGDFAHALTLRLVERIPAVAERQMSLLSAHDNVVWSSSIDEVEPVACGCLFANEVLDNLPVHLLERRSGDWVELYVGSDGAGLALEPGPLSHPSLADTLEEADLEVADGHRIEIGLAAVDLVKSSAVAVRRGALHFIDYGATWAELARRPAGTVVAYSATGVDDLVLARPGSKDVTSHANWDLVRSVLEAEAWGVKGPTPQREVLHGLGLGELQATLAEHHRKLTRAGAGAEAVRALSRRQAANLVSDPDGLGGLGVVTGTKQ